MTVNLEKLKILHIDEKIKIAKETKNLEVLKILANGLYINLDNWENEALIVCQDMGILGAIRNITLNIEDEEIKVKIAIAERDDLPLEILEILVKNKFSRVRKAVALRDDLPKKLIEKFANDNDSDIRKIIREKYNFPVADLSEFL